MIYTYSINTFSLTSTWSCYYTTGSNGTITWYIASKPTEASSAYAFPVDLPADAVISRAWITIDLGSPLSGAAYKRLNGVSIPSSGELDVTGITASSTYFIARFTFKANGKVFQDTNVHSGVLSFGTPTLHILYSSDSESGGSEDTGAPEGGIIRETGGGLQLPRLLTTSLEETRRLRPRKCSVTLNLHPLHTATMQLENDKDFGWSSDGYEIPCRSFIELFTPVGSAGVFRVTDTELVYGSGEVQTLHLESALCTLADDLVIGVQAMTGTVAEVFASLLEAQTVKYWVLGDCEVPEEYEMIYDHSYDNILEAITKLLGMLPAEYYLDLDTLRIPFVMHIRKLPEDDGCEMRLGRNLESARMSLDSRNLCTRVYPFGSGEGTDRIGLASLTGAQYLDADTINTWGVVARTFTEEDIFDSITLREVAERYLEKYKDPIVSIETTALELSQATGLDWDLFTLGKRCRLALPQYRRSNNAEVVMNEIVICQEWPDVYGDPETVKVTLANKIRNAADEIADLMREATSSKLIGGNVVTEEDTNTASNITSTSPCVHYFNITDYGNLLAARVTYTSTNQSTSAKGSCNIAVDGNTISGASSMGDTVDIFPYLDKDDSGIPTVGEHYVRFSPTASGNYYRVSSTVVLKKIERK